MHTNRSFENCHNDYALVGQEFVNTIFSPRACTRGKVTSFVCLSSVSTKITRSEDSGITVVVKCDQLVRSGKKLSFYAS